MKYKVVKVYRLSGRKKVLYSGLDIETAKKLVNSYPDSKRSMVVFYQQ